MNYSLTIFRSIFDNKTDKRMDFDSWEKFEKLLYQLSKQPGRKAKKGERFTKDVSPLISPAVYKPDATRANNNVIEWAGWAALDVDNVEESMDKVLKQYQEYYFVCYSTASSTPEKPKFRLVFPLSHSVANKDIRHFWYALNKRFNSIADEQTKDLSRMYYVPAQYPNAYNFIITNAGTFIDPSALMAQFPYVQKNAQSILDSLPDDMRREIAEQRREQMTNRDIRWISYSDCPFVNRKLVDDYKRISRVDGSGRYRMIYKIMSSIACNAIKKKYPITAKQIAAMIRELDAHTAKIYQKRPLETEADRAIEFAYKSVTH
jgi:hypothetical protein